MYRVAVVVTFVAVLVGCSGSADPPAPGNSSGASGGTGDAGGGSSGTSSGGPSVDGLPTNAADMNAFLQKKGYASWAKESALHASTGPHGTMVLTHLNPKLDASLKAGAAEHPAGSAAVKEFFNGGSVSGWAAYVKTQASSDGGNGWYWYEVFDATPGASGTQGQGLGVCTGCHSQGKDYVRIPYPLK